MILYQVSHKFHLTKTSFKNPLSPPSTSYLLFFFNDIHVYPEIKKIFFAVVTQWWWITSACIHLNIITKIIIAVCVSLEWVLIKISSWKNNNFFFLSICLNDAHGIFFLSSSCLRWRDREQKKATSWMTFMTFFAAFATHRMQWCFQSHILEQNFHFFFQVFHQSCVWLLERLAIFFFIKI